MVLFCLLLLSVAAAVLARNDPALMVAWIVIGAVAGLMTLLTFLHWLLSGSHQQGRR
jgi:hypothetical protein